MYSAHETQELQQAMRAFGFGVEYSRSSCSFVFVGETPQHQKENEFETVAPANAAQSLQNKEGCGDKYAAKRAARLDPLSPGAEGGRQSRHR